MYRELKVRKIGNSRGIVLPREVPGVPSARKGHSVSPTNVADGALRVCPAKPEVSRQLGVAQGVMHRYRHTLRELAK